MANYEIVAFDESTGQFKAPTSSDTGTVAGAVTVDLGATLASTSGNVGIGIAHGSADGKLHVHTATAGAVTANTYADDAIFENSADGGASVLVPDASTARFSLGSPTKATGAQFTWNYNASAAYLDTDKVGATLNLRADAGVANLALSGASGSERTTLSRYLSKSVTNSITAGSTQTQAGATALTTDINRVTVVGTAGDGVKLPTAVAGSEILIINDDSTDNLQIWPNTSDAIDGGAADAVDANVLAAGASRRYIAVDATNWYTA